MTGDVKPLSQLITDAGNEVSNMWNSNLGRKIQEYGWKTKALEAQVKKLLKWMEEHYWLDLGCQGKLDILPIIEAKDNAESHLREAQKQLDNIREALNHSFGIGWIEKKFNASSYGSEDSIDLADDVAKIIRDAALGGEVAEK